MRLTRLLIAALLLSSCAHKLPICEPAMVGTEEWSRPCRSADETNTETGALDLPDPADLDAGQ